MLPSESWYIFTRELGAVLSPKWMHRCAPSLRGCMRTSMTLSLIGVS
jgi:hypothetical protein